MKQKLQTLFITLLICLLGGVNLSPANAASVSIPQSIGTFIDLNAAGSAWKCEQCSIDKGESYNGQVIGNIKGTSPWATLSLTNATQQDMVLVFKTGTSKGTYSPQVTVTLAQSETTLLSKEIKIVDTGGWTPTTEHVIDLKDVPAGDLTLKFSFSNTDAGQYVGNLGYIALYTKADYNSLFTQVPGDKFELNSTTLWTFGKSTEGYKEPQYLKDNENIRFVYNGGYMYGYPFYVTANGSYNLSMGIDRNNVGQFKLTVSDYFTGEEELTQTFDVPALSGYATHEFELTQDLTKGLKKMRLDFIAGEGVASNAWIFNFNKMKFIDPNAAPLAEYTVTYAKDEEIEGEVPSAIVVDEGSTTTLPVNRTMYKEGYSLTGWTDGSKTYAPGETYTPTGDVTLTAKFTQNAVSIGDAEEDVKVRWDLRGNNGAPIKTWEQKTGLLVTQAVVNGNTIDMKMDIDATNGKFSVVDRGDYCQINDNTIVKLPTVTGMSILIDAWYDSYDYEIDGTAVDQDSKQTIYQYTGSTNPVPVKFVHSAYFNYIEVTYPGTIKPWSRFESFELDMTNGNYITSSETSVVTIGVKKGTEGMVRCEEGDADAIATVSGKFHSNEHGLKEFTMTVAVPGKVKISAGTCAWGGNLTIKSSDDKFSKTINTNNGICFHGDKTKNKVITYYDGEGTTLTISGGIYMPYIAVESVETVPTEYTVNFYNGEELVSTQKVYEGTTLSSLPAAPSVTDGKHFRGWYTSCDAEGVKAKIGTVIEKNMNFYAVMDITMQNGYVIVEKDNGQSLLNALEYTKEKAGADVQKIWVPNGTYDFGAECRTEVGSNVAIIGESREGVTIVNHPDAEGIQATSVLRVTGDNVYMQNLTLRCDVSYPGSKVSGVGVALEINGDKLVCNNVELQGNQDTFCSNGKESQRGYFKGGRIEGAVDYVCGGGNMWFEGTTFYNNGRSIADVIFAPSTSAQTQYGYVANNCIIDGDVATQAGKWNIARPWQGSPAVTLLNAKCMINPSAAGYTSMGSGLTLRFHEYNTVDAEGNAITGHNTTACSPAADSEELYLSEIGKYTYANVMQSTDGWDPEAVIAQYCNDAEVGSTGFATIGFPYATILPAGVTGYAVTGVTSTAVTLTEVPSGTNIAANTGLIIVAKQGSYTFPVVESGTEIENNKLVANTEGVKTATTEGEFYVLAVTNEATKTVGLARIAQNGTLAKNRAYMPANVIPDNGSAQPATFRLVFGDATMVTEVGDGDAEAVETVVYNLAGQRVNDNVKGLVVVKGRVYLKK